VEKEALGIWLDVQAETWEGGSGPRTPRKDGESATEESMSSLSPSVSKENSNKDYKEALETTRLTFGAGEDTLVTVRSFWCTTARRDDITHTHTHTHSHTHTHTPPLRSETCG